MFRFSSIFKIITVLLLCFNLFSCDKEPTSNAETEISGGSGISYKTSKNSWEELKARNGTSYSYTVETSSWTGFETKTVIRVVEDEVVGRDFESKKVVQEDGEVNVEILESYSETSTELNSHENGAAPLTVNELYDTCLSEYLVVDRAENTIYFDTFNSGIINICGYSNKYCADDCFHGFKITDFNWQEN